MAPCSNCSAHAFKVAAQININRIVFYVCSSVAGLLCFDFMSTLYLMGFLCLVPAGGPLSRPAESTEQVGAGEHNNGLRKNAKDCSAGKEESVIPQPSQVEPVTQSDTGHNHGSEAGQKGSESGVELMESQVGDETNIKEDTDNGTEVAPEGANSSVPSRESNNLDFDLSSDSDNDSTTGRPRSLNSGGEGKSFQTKESGVEREGQETTDGDATKEKDNNVSSEVENSCGVSEPSAVVSSGPELGNGCLDRREPETESQNSEQSGVTVGGELLDQSMEDEEEEDEADNDQDDHLIYLEEVLERIHTEYFTRYETYLRKETSEMPDIRRIVPELKSKTLEGTMLMFSGLYPTNYPKERTREYYHAKALGAKVGKNLVLNPQDPNQTTHLIAARAGMYRHAFMI